MDNINNTLSCKLDFAQIAWVVKDVDIAKTFFMEMLNCSDFSHSFCDYGQ
jgi:hypothetical protein